MADFFLKDNHVTWDELKALAVSKRLNIQFHDIDSQYRIFITDNRVIYWTEIYQSGAPLPIGIDSGQNTTDRTDFEANYMSNSNEAAVSKSEMQDGYGNPISITRDESTNTNRMLVSADVTTSPIIKDRDRVVVVDFHNEDLASELVGDDFYALVIDLDDAPGTYKHSPGTAISLVGASGLLLKTKNSDIWNIIFGTVLSIDGTQGTVGWLQVGSLNAADTNQFGDRTTTQPFPVITHLEVSGGDYTKIGAGFKETLTEINTGAPIRVLGGTSAAPAVGDLVARARRTTGTGTAAIHYSLWYYVE